MCLLNVTTEDGYCENSHSSISDQVKELFAEKNPLVSSLSSEQHVSKVSVSLSKQYILSATDMS